MLLYVRVVKSRGYLCAGLRRRWGAMGFEITPKNVTIAKGYIDHRRIRDSCFQTSLSLTLHLLNLQNTLDSVFQSLIHGADCSSVSNLWLKTVLTGEIKRLLDLTRIQSILRPNKSRASTRFPYWDTISEVWEENTESICHCLVVVV